jgi:hypothetical protein
MELGDLWYQSKMRGALTTGGVALVLCGLVGVSSPLAQALTQRQLRVANNIQEYTACGYYYRLQLACAPPEGKARSAINTGIEVVRPGGNSFFGQGIGMTKDAIEQRLRRVAANMAGLRIIVASILTASTRDIRPAASSSSKTPTL